MQFTATQEITAPIDAVWTQLTDFDRFEQAVVRHGGKAERQGDGPVGPGTRWRGAAEVLGKIRHMDLTPTRMEVPGRLTAEALAEGVAVTLDVTLEAVAEGRTRMTVAADAEARSLGAKIVLKPLALAHGRLQEQFEGRVSGFAKRIEAAA